MTAKQAIKARCLDCAGFKCTDIGCALFGLMKSKGGAKRPAAIKAYCRWCMNGHPISLCASPDCGIYQYRRDVGGVAFLPKNSPEKTQLEGFCACLGQNPGNDQGNIGKEAKTVLFKVGDRVRVKPPEWFDALPVSDSGLSFTPEGSAVGGFHREAAGREAQVTGRKAGDGGGALYKLRGLRYWFPGEILEAADVQDPPDSFTVPISVLVRGMTAGGITAPSQWRGGPGQSPENGAAEALRGKQQGIMGRVGDRPGWFNLPLQAVAYALPFPSFGFCRLRMQA